MKRVEDFNEFLSDHVNINQSRLDKLNDHVAAVTTHLSRHLESYEKVERQGSYAFQPHDCRFGRRGPFLSLEIGS